MSAICTSRSHPGLAVARQAAAASIARPAAVCPRIKSLCSDIRSMLSMSVRDGLYRLGPAFVSFCAGC
jgi:hypothetical protein